MRMRDPVKHPWVHGKLRIVRSVLDRVYDEAREGYAREYLCINGTWQDHLLYARLKDVAKP